MTTTYHEFGDKKLSTKLELQKRERRKRGEKQSLKIVFFFSVRVMEVDTFKQISTLENGIGFG